MSVADPSAEGRTIGDGRYTLLQEIGRGGAGVVWRAVDQRIQRPVAIKEAALAPELSAKDRETALSRVRREVRTAGALNHPATVTLYDVLWEHNAIYIIMELVEGASLSDTLARTGPLRPQWASRIALDILDALQAAHSAGIVHRDLKPSNIMLPSSDARAKLADFGIAQVHEDTKLTQTGNVVGSPAYLSPEQINGDPVTPAVDLWQLGVVLYCMLHGISPFARDSGQATLYAILGYTPPPLNCGEPLSGAVTALLSKQPEQRPTAAQLRPVLEQYAATTRQPENATTRRHSSRGQQRPGGRRRRALLVAGTAVAMVCFLAAGVLLDRFVGPPRAGAEMAKPPDVLSWDTTNNVYNIEQGTVDMTDVDFGNSGCANGSLQPNGTLRQTRCADEHSIEVFASFALPRSEDGSYPSNMSQVGPSFCEASFASYRDYAWVQGHEIMVTAMVPSEQRWNVNSEFRNILYCAAHPADGSDFSDSELAPR